MYCISFLLTSRINSWVSKYTSSIPPHIRLAHEPWQHQHSLATPSCSKNILDLCTNSKRPQPHSGFLTSHPLATRDLFGYTLPSTPTPTSPSRNSDSASRAPQFTWAHTSHLEGRLLVLIMDRWILTYLPTLPTLASSTQHGADLDFMVCLTGQVSTHGSFLFCGWCCYFI